MTKKYKTAIGYLRVSTLGQGKLGTSLESQREKIKNFCVNNGIILLGMYVDTFSGKNFIRPEFEKSYKFLKENKEDIDLFLTIKTDRFTRDVKTGLETFDEIKKLGVEVNFVDEWIDNIDSAQGRLMMSMKMTFAEFDRLSIIERTRLGEKVAMKSGRYIKTPPHGYRRGTLSNGKKGIILNDKSYLIKELFEDYATGLFSQKELVNKFKLKGLHTSKTAISIILDNILYTGQIDLKKHKISPYTLIKGLHEPIISEELYYKVQEIKKGKNRMIKKTRPKNIDFPLSGFMKCVCCGSPMYGSKSNNGKQKKITREYSFYRCSKNCKEQSYKPEIVHFELLNNLASIKPSVEIVDLFEKILIDGYKETLTQKKNLTENIDHKIRQIENEQLSLVEKYALGKIEEDFYEKLMDKKKIELAEIKAERYKYCNYQEDLDKYLSFGLSILTNLDFFYENAPVEVKVQLLGSYFSNKLIFDKNKFRTLPFNEVILLLCRYNKGLESIKKETGEDFSINSRLVLRAGLEPARTLLFTGF
jgi:site-specific DNA recombinase